MWVYFFFYGIFVSYWLVVTPYGVVFICFYFFLQKTPITFGRGDTHALGGIKGNCIGLVIRLPLFIYFFVTSWKVDQIQERNGKEKQRGELEAGEGIAKKTSKACKHSGRGVFILYAFHLLSLLLYFSFLHFLSRYPAPLWKARHVDAGGLVHWKATRTRSK